MYHLIFVIKKKKTLTETRYICKDMHKFGI